MNQLIFLILFFGIVTSISKKQISQDQKQTELSQYKNLISQQDFILIEQLSNWNLVKKAFFIQTQQLYTDFKWIIQNQQIIGISLVLIISYSFYLMIKQENNRLKQKKKNKQQQEQEQKQENLQILIDSINQPIAQIIHCSISYDPRVNKTNDDFTQNIIQESRSQPLLNKQDQSVDELNCLLNDLN